MMPQAADQSGYASQLSIFYIKGLVKRFVEDTFKIAEQP